jgi:hypothetical protein
MKYVLGYRVDFASAAQCRRVGAGEDIGGDPGAMVMEALNQFDGIHLQLAL